MVCESSPSSRKSPILRTLTQFRQQLQFSGQATLQLHSPGEVGLRTELLNSMIVNPAISASESEPYKP